MSFTVHRNTRVMATASVSSKILRIVESGDSKKPQHRGLVLGPERMEQLALRNELDYRPDKFNSRAGLHLACCLSLCSLLCTCFGLCFVLVSAPFVPLLGLGLFVCVPCCVLGVLCLTLTIFSHAAYWISNIQSDTYKFVKNHFPSPDKAPSHAGASESTGRSDRALREHIDGLRRTAPVISFNAVCYHYEMKTDSQGEEKKERVVTWRGREVVPVLSWTDVSADFEANLSRRYLKLYLEKAYYFSDPESELAFHDMCSKFEERHRYRDLVSRHSHCEDVLCIRISDCAHANTSFSTLTSGARWMSVVKMSTSLSR